ncbi:MAG TPA: hypothetical protein VN706_07175 [Gemmatimonadaceae bacterium]|nr:hypothetical protein [Gemmatimonadaceae bacterium]
MTRRPLIRFILGVAFCFPCTFAVAQATTAPTWGPLGKLLGSWTADSGGGGRPGMAVRGGETWVRDLNDRVIVRRDFSEYPATAQRAAFRHEGLMVIAPAAAGFAARAFDNEGHVITYQLVASDTAIVLTSDAVRAQPQFRLTYRPTPNGYDVGFEIAPPDRPGEFKPYVAGRLHRAP